MNRLHVATRGISSWRGRLAKPDSQWRRCYSAFEAAVSWELAASCESGLPAPIQALLETAYGAPKLLMAIAEHKVPLRGGTADSQNDIWALLDTAVGMVSLAVEAKARESFGNDALAGWLGAGKSVKSRANREVRWSHLRDHLPVASEDAYSKVAYQLLHRCASAVIEAKRFGLNRAACIIQAFGAPDDRFGAFCTFCRAAGVSVSRGTIQKTRVGDIELAIGWADCPLASDEQIASLA